MAYLIFLFFISKGTAGGDVTCWDNSCLKSGWTWQSTNTGQMVDYGCYREGCDVSGWIIGTFPQTYTQCKDAGCFIEGWYYINSQNQQVLQNVVCREQNNERSCFKFGWVIYSQFGQDAVVSCLDYDCEHKGWFAQGAQSFMHVYCKEGGCFQQGWREVGP